MDLQLPADFKPKKYWEKSEGTAGMIILVGLGLLGYWALPHLINLMENILYLGLLCLAFAAGLYIAFDRSWRTLFWNGFKSISRGLARFWATIDPIGIMENYLQDFKENREKTNGLVQNLAGGVRTLGNLIKTNEETKKRNLQLASSAQKRMRSDPRMKTEMVIKARKAGRLENSNMRLSDLYKKMEMLYRVLLKMVETLDYMIEDLEDEITVRKQEYSAIKKAYSAFKAAMRQAQGDPDKKQMFEMAMEYQANDYGQKLGEIEHMIEMSSSFIRSVDLENCVYEESAMKMLDEWEKKTDSLILSPIEKQDILDRVKNDDDVIDLEAIPVVQPREKEPVKRFLPEETETTYEKLFNK